MRVFLILGDLPTNYASGTTAFFAVVGIDHFWVGYESIHRVNLVGKTFQLSKPLSLVHAESFGGSLPFPLDIFFSYVRLLALWYYPSRMSVRLCHYESRVLVNGLRLLLTPQRASHSDERETIWCHAASLFPCHR